MTPGASEPTRSRPRLRAIDQYIPDLRAALLLFITAALAVVISVFIAPNLSGALGAALALTVLSIAIIDNRTFRIPDGLNITGIVLALGHAIVQTPDAWISAVFDAVLRGAVLALIFLGLRWCYAAIRGQEGIGLGDVKLAAVAGAWLGWIYMPVAIQIAAFAALTLCVFRYLWSGRAISMTNRLPFGAFFAPAIWITWVLERLASS